LSSFKKSRFAGLGDHLAPAGSAQFAVDRFGLRFDGVGGQEQFLLAGRCVTGQAALDVRAVKLVEL
jgi:hypothetical protein